MEQAAEELGVSVEEVAGSLRNERQREMVDNARRLAYCAELMPREVPKPRRALTNAKARRGTYRPAPVMVSSDREVARTLETKPSKRKTRAEARSR